ncbi:putative metal-dependent hydrolase [Desulfurella amilsii]|uniref:Putative metal-dependent hydrolase n=1 Tax=Desulfurella amilsii TaxID=1562698 RepID=A0A1X4XZJ6_9BACT|nr:SprT family zinc-dependent metalloprotease [Desulfurella amilsii]OSS42967.1 putative metal-dependent hydrolase [Desulfurella amilsii]
MQAQVIFSKRKTISLIITDHADLILRVPFGTDKKLINKIIDEKKDWIERKINEIKQIKPVSKNSYQDKETFYYLGELLTLKIVNSQKNSVLIENETLLLSLKKQSKPECILIKWYKQQASKFIFQRCVYYANILGCKFKSITITSAKKRLGSCDFQRNLRFSFYNILLDEAYIDYVVVHELCHLFYLNHSKAFWQKVQSIMPDFKQKRLWLRKNFYIMVSSL